MAVANFFLDLRGRAADGKGSIIIRLYHNGSTVTIPTKIRVAPVNWDGNKVIKLGATSDILNAHLSKQKSEIDNSIALLSMTDDLDKMTALQIKNAIIKKPLKQSPHLVSSLFQEYMQTGIKEGTREIYGIALKKVLAFGGNNLRMEDIDLKWLKQFEVYLSKTQSINGRSIYLRSLRAICNYAHDTGVIDTYPFDNFKIKSEPTKKRSVPVELLRKFKDYPTTELFSMYRDYFFLMFYLIGINIKDLLLAKKSQVDSGRLEYIRAKTGKKYSIKIEPEAQELIYKHAGKGDYLLDAMDHCQHYKSFSHQLNDAIKLIGDKREIIVPDEDDLFGEPKIESHITPVIPGITSYFARHCWATYAYKIGIPIDVISQALGHADGNRTTLIYIKRDQKKIDEANRKVIDYLLLP